MTIVEFLWERYSEESKVPTCDGAKMALLGSNLLLVAFAKRMLTRADELMEAAKSGRVAGPDADEHVFNLSQAAAMEVVCRMLATAYSNHPGYDPAWAIPEVTEVADSLRAVPEVAAVLESLRETS